MNHNKSNRARRERKGDWPEAAQSVKVYFVRGQPETQVKAGVTGDGQPSRLHLAERNIDQPIRFCNWLLGDAGVLSMIQNYVPPGAKGSNVRHYKHGARVRQTCLNQADNPLSEVS
jgi:hypothetical protein